ncbi:alpha-hydroxy acid oxidase [Ramlibacter rhizophilus]|uniref:Alpha-hydroxy-acid oxidizing protein n=1 Tax=Ramlibacter rhizophilus TaxID=1781167 RepID=A0A4Z0BS08_9BURK|nr:alpha-hydroxy acid oxidase [Ramlibacter rhizophilus]TFZ01244.1 alpha-hydroxy-acid oxidizing protein [Ramlibacter rhizophilus]
MGDPLRHTRIAQLAGSPRRRYYTGADLRRAVAVEDLRAMAHRRMPRFVLEYLEGGAEEEASLARDRLAFGDWRFMPRQLVDVSARSLACELLGRRSALPLVIAPTGLNGLFREGGDLMLARAAAAAGVPYVQSTMSNDRMEDVARTPGLRHWWQLYVFGGEEVWQSLVQRADACGCEALVLTTNAQIFGNREWSRRTRAGPARPSAATVLDAALHPRWIAATLLRKRGLPVFRNVIDFVPRERRGFFETAHWIREQQPESLDWRLVERIRLRWPRPFLLKGLLHPEDVRRAVDAGVDGIVLSSHGGRQLDQTIAPLDLLAEAVGIARGRVPIHLAGGVRRGTDLLKALALGATSAWVARAPLYGLCAGGEAGVQRALEILGQEAFDAMGLLGAASLDELGPGLIRRV